MLKLCKTTHYLGYDALTFEIQDTGCGIVDKFTVVANQEYRAFVIRNNLL